MHCPIQNPLIDLFFLQTSLAALQMLGEAIFNNQDADIMGVPS